MGDKFLGFGCLAVVALIMAAIGVSTLGPVVTVLLFIAGVLIEILLTLGKRSQNPPAS